MRRQSGVLLAALVLGAGLGGLAGAGPAAAGGFAVTVLDSPPSRIEAGKAYQISFWVLQHGSHPFWDKSAAASGVGLTLTDARGERLSFPGKEQAEPAHYVTTVTVPRNGTWQLTGVQGAFPSYDVGTLTVPGSLYVRPVPAAPSAADLAKYWPGAVRPPVLLTEEQARGNTGQPVTAVEQPVAQAPAAAQAADSTAGRDANDAVPVRPGIVTTVAIVAGGLLLVAALAIGVRRRWSRRWGTAPH
jgi:hypothetical protein